MEVSYRRELDHNYLVLEEKEFQENYQVNMLLKNRIPGFLECRMTRVDKKAFFYYEITSRQNLRLVLERKRLSLTEMIRLLEGLSRRRRPARNICWMENGFCAAGFYLSGSG